MSLGGEKCQTVQFKRIIWISVILKFLLMDGYWWRLGNVAGPAQVTKNQIKNKSCWWLTKVQSCRSSPNKYSKWCDMASVRPAFTNTMLPEVAIIVLTVYKKNSTFPVSVEYSAPTILINPFNSISFNIGLFCLMFSMVK